MADNKIQSCLFDENFPHIFGYKKKNNRQKKILRPSGRKLYIK